MTICLSVFSLENVLRLDNSSCEFLPFGTQLSCLGERSNSPCWPTSCQLDPVARGTLAGGRRGQVGSEAQGQEKAPLELGEAAGVEHEQASL